MYIFICILCMLILFLKYLFNIFLEDVNHISFQRSIPPPPKKKCMEAANKVHLEEKKSPIMSKILISLPFSLNFFSYFKYFKLRVILLYLAVISHFYENTIVKLLQKQGGNRLSGFSGMGEN